MLLRRLAAFGSLLFVAATLACTSKSSSSVAPCRDGDRRACTDGDGCEGTSTCEAQAWSECVCDGAGGSGSGGDGGSGASTGGAAGAEAESSATTRGGDGATGGSSSSGGAQSSGGAGGTGGVGGTAATGGSGGTGETGGSAGAGGTGGTSGAGGAGGTSGSAGAPSDEACPQGLPGPRLVHVPALARPAFCMDATEVTRAEYRVFLEAEPKPDWSSVCDFADDSTPETVSGCSGHWPPTSDTQNHPVVCVSYCQAERYCEWAGKRLCTGNFNARTSFTTSEAYAACSREGQFAFPYGDSLDITACNSYYGTGIPAEVASYPGCEGGYAGLFDLAGNVEEWVDSCIGSDGATDQCGVFGKDYGDHDPQCNDTYARNRALQAPNTGFRCCADELSD